MVEEDNWKVFPRKGMGRLQFGMSPAEVDAWSETYGNVKGRANDRASDDLLRDTLERFGSSMTEKEKQEFIAAYQQSGPSPDSVTETRGHPGLVLRYETNRLVEIMPAKGQRPLILDGKDLFSLSALEAMRLLERLNGGPGRYAGGEAAFDQLAISTDGFCLSDKDAGVRTLGEADELFQDRTVTLRQKPYFSEGEMDRFIVLSLLE